MCLAYKMKNTHLPSRFTSILFISVKSFHNSSGDPIAPQSVAITKAASPYFTTEGQWGEYQIRLTSPPQGTVDLLLASPDQKTSIETSTFSFNRSNWAISQKLRVSPIRDFNLLDSPYDLSLSLFASSTDPSFNFTGTQTNFNFLAFNSDEG